MEKLGKIIFITFLVAVAFPVYLFEKAKDVYCYLKPILPTIGFVVIGWGLIYLMMRWL